jgi:ATP phosphoribosyltransferase regulatory subunit
MSSVTPDTAGGAGTPRTIPVPTGTRDVLPEEMAELRAISVEILRVFAESGYGEVATPALEFESSMQVGGAELLEHAYRVADKDGQILTLRFDSTVPIARLAATRYSEAEPPLRFCYMQHVYRAVEPKRAQQRQFLQVGMELLGLPAPEGDAEALELLVKVLNAAGLNDFKIAVGDVSFFESKLAATGVDDATREAVLHELHTRDFVGFRKVLAGSGVPQAQRAELERIASARGGRELLEREGAENLLELDAKLSVTESIIYDLGLVRDLDYYSGTVIEVYTPSSGFPLGGGGRYDNLVGRFGRELAAFGFSLNMERLHLAVLEEQEGGR